MTDPADILRRAADTLEVAACAASQPWQTRWQALHDNSWLGPNVVADADGHPRLTAGESGTGAAEDVDYIALVDPTVGD